MKKINNQQKMLLATIFFVVFCFGFNINNTQAQNLNPTGECTYKCPADRSIQTTIASGVNTLEDCLNFCETACPGGRGFNGTAKTFGCYFEKESYLPSFFRADPPAATTLKHELGQEANNKAYEEEDDVCKNLKGWDVLNPLALIECLLLYVLVVLGKLLQLAGTLFAWIVDPEAMNSILDNGAVYSSWSIVRDILNVFFIMFLLFSAFSTVFQIEKYNYKKTLLTLVIMALLVNFSYPITRFIIDLSNVLMFYFVGMLGLENTLVAQIANDSFLYNIIYPSGSPGLTYLIISIIFLFIFTITMLTIAFLLLIRSIALALLIIFSSLAFVGEAIPPLSSYASDWWKKLFSYAFFGPIMIFMLVVSSNMMAQISSEGLGKVQEIANLNSHSPNYITSLSFFTIPIIILWFGLGIASQMSIAGAGVVTSKARGFMKGAGRKVTGKLGYDFAKNTYKKYKDERGERKAELDKTSLSTRLGSWAGNKPGEIRDEIQSKKYNFRGKEFELPGSKKAKGRQEDKTQRGILEKRKKWKDEGASQEQLEKSLNSKNVSEQRAAALEMSERNFEGKEEGAALKNYQKAKEVLSGDQINEKTFENKAKEKHISLIIKDEIQTEEKNRRDNNETPLSENETKEIYVTHLNKLDNNEFASQKDLNLKDNHVRNYIENRYTKNTSNHQDVFRKLSGENQEKWADAGLVPGEKLNLKPTPKRSHEEIQNELKTKNDQEINRTPSDAEKA